jgi:hypothetical protein
MADQDAEHPQRFRVLVFLWRRSRDWAWGEYGADCVESVESVKNWYKCIPSLSSEVQESGAKLLDICALDVCIGTVFGTEG